MTWTRAPPAYRCGDPAAWPITPAVTSKPVPRLWTVTVSPVRACLAAALGEPGHTWKLALAYGSELSKGPAVGWPDAVGAGLAAGDDDADAGEEAGAAAPGVTEAWPPGAAFPASDGATVAARPVHPCQASSRPTMPVTASKAIPHRPTCSPPSRIFGSAPGSWERHAGIVTRRRAPPPPGDASGRARWTLLGSASSSRGYRANGVPQCSESDAASGAKNVRPRATRCASA